MQKDSASHNKTVLNAVGHAGIHSGAAQQVQQEVASYKVVAFDHVPEEYRNMIFSKWKRSLRYENDYFKLIDCDAYFKAYDKYLSGILAADNLVFTIATLSDDIDVVLGFSVSRGTVLDYVYVNKEFRRIGVGARLIPRGITTITHLTKTGMTIWNNKYSAWKFNPFA